MINTSYGLPSPEPRKVIGLPGPQFDLMFVWKTRQLCWILFPLLVRLKTKLNFFLKVLWKKLIKIKTRRIYKGHHLTSITENKITAAHTVWCVYLLFLTSFTTENSLKSSVLKFGVSLKHFIVFAKPWLQLLRTK